MLQAAFDFAGKGTKTSLERSKVGTLLRVRVRMAVCCVLWR